jgi:hypothetical protein
MNARLLAGLALAGAALAACTSGPAKADYLRPNPDQFRSGTCHDAAPAVLSVGDIARSLDGKDALSEADNKALSANQKKLAGLRTSAELSTPVRELVVSIGYVRLRADSRTYDPALVAPMAAAQQKVVRSCVD